MPDPLKNIRHRERPLRSRWTKPAPPIGGPPPIPPTHDLQVIVATPPLNPDCTGFYDEAGESDGHTVYKREDGYFTIWYHPIAAKYVIAQELPYAAIYWLHTLPGDDPTGLYTPIGGATGVPLAQLPP